MQTYTYDYLIVGGGLAADAAARGIRSSDSHGSIALLSAEAVQPYDRPALSKALWRGATVESIFRGTDAHDVELHLGRRAVRLDPREHVVTDEFGDVFRYGKVLLATGAPPRLLPFAREHILYLRTLDDYTRIRKLAGEGGRFVVIGGGFIGSEIAAALATNGNETTLVFPEQGIGGRRFPDDLSGFLGGYYRERNVAVVPKGQVVDVRRVGGELVVMLADGQQLAADGVVAGIGSRPASGLAAGAGAEVADGIDVDERLRTSLPDVYAAGDVACFLQPSLDRRMRIEHEDNAKRMGEHAGRNMAGDDQPYRHLPFFYSDLFDLGYEAVGILDNRLETVEAWEDPYRKGVVYYLDAGRVAGVLLWNTWGMLDQARGLIGRTAPRDRSRLAMAAPVHG